MIWNPEIVSTFNNISIEMWIIFGLLFVSFIFVGIFSNGIRNELREMWYVVKRFWWIWLIITSVGIIAGLCEKHNPDEIAQREIGRCPHCYKEIRE